MWQFNNVRNRRVRALTVGATLFALAGGAMVLTLGARKAPLDDFDHFRFLPGNLVVSRSVYDNRAANVTVGETLPPNCGMTTGGCGGAAVTDGTFPYVFNNDSVDGSFGITSKLYLDQMTQWGWTIDSLELPNNLQLGFKTGDDKLVTSFSSKSEGALNLSTSGKYLTFEDYVADVNTVDASNANTPGVVDPTNPVGENVYRAAATVDSDGNFHFTESNAYSGNNPRAAILNDTDGANVIYSAGNAGNGANPQPAGILLGAGAQIFNWLKSPESAQTPGTPTPVGSFNVTQLGDKADKLGKDDNFRGLRIFNNVLYYTKGSGSNGVDTVYFLDTTGSACPNGTGIPSSTATLPTTPLAYNAATLLSKGLPSNMCILNGFPTDLAKTATSGFPFGLWFADANTLYVADEGDGFASDSTLYSHAAAQTTAGLQKWIFNTTTGKWSMAYVLTNALEIGTPYTVKDYPTGNNSGVGGTNLPWAPATDGLRNITGKVLPDGTAVIWAITSTVSGSGDQGADPNKLVVIADKLSDNTAAEAANERFYSLRTSKFAEVLRGVSFTPGTGVDEDKDKDKDNRWGWDKH